MMVELFEFNSIQVYNGEKNERIRNLFQLYLPREWQLESRRFII